MRQRGSASTDYLGVIAVIGIMFIGLVGLRPREVRSTNPVDVIPPIVRLLGAPVRNLAPRPSRPRSTPSRPRPRKPRPEAVPRDRVIVPLPDWWR